MGKRVNIYFKDDTIHLLRLKVDNVSEFVDFVVSKALNSESLEEIRKKKLLLKQEIDALDAQEERMIKAGVKETKMEAIGASIWEELCKIFTNRVNNRIREHSHPFNDESDMIWLGEGKGFQRCKLMNKEPRIVLMDLKEWYNETKGVKTE